MIVIGSFNIPTNIENHLLVHVGHAHTIWSILSFLPIPAVEKKMTKSGLTMV